MRHWKLVLAASPLLAATPAAEANAQAISTGLSGGLSVPVGSGSDVVDNGFNIAAHLDVRAPALPIGVRVDAAYNRWGIKDLPESIRSIAGIVNGMLFVPRPAGSPIRPYVSAGVGVYNFRGVFDGQSLLPGGFESETRVGLNAGAGIEARLGGVTGFLEGRYHSVFTPGQNSNFVPIVLGVRL